MSGGGGQQTVNSTTQPYREAIPYLNDALSRVSRAGSNTPSYYPGPLTIGPTTAENRAWQQQSLADANTYGKNGPQLDFTGVAGGLNSQLQGGGYGNLAGATLNAGNQVSSAFQSAQSPLIGRYGFDTSINPSGAAPQYGVAGSLDARSALQQQLSGQPDYAGVQGSIDAANAPILRDFQNNLLPSLNSRATFLNNSTGGYKTLATALPDLGQRLSQNALQVTEGERQRALAAQASAAQQISQGGLAGYGLGLQQQQAQVGANQALAGQNLSTDVAGAGAQSQYLNNLLGYGGLAGNYAGGLNDATGRALAFAPSIYQLGNTPNQNLFNYAGYNRGLQEQALSAQQNKFNYLRDYPQQQASWYANQIAGLSGLGGSSTQTTTQPNGSPLAGALGGGLAGYYLGGALGGAGAAAGAGAGAASGAASGSWAGPVGAGLGALLGLVLS